ncbi:ABC transporter permease [Bacillus sp. FJAT-29790]|nr:ABC transporter permease [Bacillus sp. FJAT-29790]
MPAITKHIRAFFKLSGRSWSHLNLKTNIELLHQRYLYSLNREKKWVRFYQLIIFLVFFSGWELASQKQWVDPLIFSAPSKVWELFLKKIQDGTLFVDLSFTLSETVLGFILGTILGTLLAAILWWSPMLSKIFDPYLVILNSMPKVALGPILIVALGPSFTSIVAMGAIISIIITTIVVYTSFKEVDPNYIKVLQTFSANRFQIFKEAVLPASFPVIISTLKVNVGLSWVGVIVGEFLVSSKGLGYMIIYGFQVFNFTLVMLSLIVIAVFATVMYQLVALLERKLIKNGS